MTEQNAQECIQLTDGFVGGSWSCFPAQCLKTGCSASFMLWKRVMAVAGRMLAGVPSDWKQQAWNVSQVGSNRSERAFTLGLFHKLLYSGSSMTKRRFCIIW